jgi:hypothetical protein
VYTHSDRYQDLTEHVSQPNREPSIKAAFQCPNKSCIANHCDVSWIEDGEYYTGKRPEGITYTQLNDALKEKHGTGFAVNSWCYHYELGKFAINKRRKRIHIGKYRIDIEPKAYGYDYPIEKQYHPRKFGWVFQCWRETEDGCYTSITPIYRMIKYYLRQFNMHHRNVSHNPDANKGSIKDAMEIINCTQWGSPDKRSFARISSALIKIIYPNKVKLIKEMSARHLS